MCNHTECCAHAIYRVKVASVMHDATLQRLYSIAAVHTGVQYLVLNFASPFHQTMFCIQQSAILQPPSVPADHNVILFQIKSLLKFQIDPNDYCIVFLMHPCTAENKTGEGDFENI